MTKFQGKASSGIVTNLPANCMASYPFLTATFFSALEDSGATVAHGWQPLHVNRNDCFLPVYLRNESWGEFVFDQSWAHASQRAGIPYYPKLVSAVPFTPVPGPRWRGCPDAGMLWEEVRERLARTGASSWHLLFPDADALRQLDQLPLIERQACHFRWNNRGYASFDDFLTVLTSRKRKDIRKERARVQEQGVRVEWRVGSEIPMEWWPAFYRCYAMTYYQRGQAPYLPASFFTRLHASPLAEQLALCVALEGEEVVAAAFYLFDEHSLYGRYWGAVADFDGLHFELCYYQGIEFCIARGLQRFDPGVQGEHKILRGFEPEITRSLHWFENERLRAAVQRFCAEEARAVTAYRNEARTLLPFRQS